MLPVSSVNERLESQIVFPDPETRVGYFPDESWVDAPVLTRTIVRAASSNEGFTLLRDTVDGIEIAAKGVTVSLENGETVDAEAVVNATGAGAAPVAGMVGRGLPLDVFPGLLVRVAVPGEPLGHLLHTPRINLRPDGPGYVLLHHGSVDEELTDDFAGTEDPLCAELLQRARRLLPALEEAEIVEARFGWRPVPADGHSCVGGLSRLPGYYEAVTHSGITLGPLLGRLLAREILTGEVDPLVAPFRPDRFAEAQT
jgi:glycine/D-amino acid oxidase-like deaminating enzyme